MQRRAVFLGATATATATRPVCAGALWVVGAAFISGVTDADTLAYERHIRGGQHDPWRLRATGWAIYWLCAAGHPLYRFERATICALVFVNWHGALL